MKQFNKISSIFISFLLIISMFLLNIINASAIDDAYYSLINKDEIIPYTYENSSVTSSLNSLIDRTETLKTSYSLNEAISILNDLKNTVKNITSNDYKNNYNLKHNDKNYETGNFYKYKNGHTAWIEENVIYLILTNSISSETEVKDMLQTLYDISKIEMNEGAIESDTNILLVNMMYISEDLPKSLQNFVNFVGSLAASDSMNYENGKKPSTDSLSKAYEDYQQEQKDKENESKEIEESNSKVNTIEEKQNTFTSDYDSFDSTSIKEDDITTISNENSIPSNETSVDNYINSMNQAASGRYVSVKKYVYKNIYYTLDKTAENPTWNDTGITITDDGDIDYEKLMNVLNVIGRNDGYFFMEDADMSMLVADGNVLVLNKVDIVKEDEINSLCDVFDKLGIKIMLKSDEDTNSSNLLSTKIEKGEVNTISVNGDNLILTNKPILTKNVLQLPIDEVATTLGYKVSMDDKTITLTTDDTTIVLTIGSNNFTINGQKNSFKTPVTKDNDVVYCEFDKIASKLGYNYTFNSNTNMIEFTK